MNNENINEQPVSQTATSVTDNTETKELPDTLIYDHAAKLLFVQGKSPKGAVMALIEMGVEQQKAATIVDELSQQMKSEKKDAGKKDMIYGALWCIGGTVLTFMNIGFIFWGAIVFGGYQFIKGLIAYSSDD